MVGSHRADESGVRRQLWRPGWCVAGGLPRSASALGTSSGARAARDRGYGRISTWRLGRLRACRRDQRAPAAWATRMVCYWGATAQRLGVGHLERRARGALACAHARGRSCFGCKHRPIYVALAISCCAPGRKRSARALNAAAPMRRRIRCARATAASGSAPPRCARIRGARAAHDPAFCAWKVAASQFKATPSAEATCGARAPPTQIDPNPKLALSREESAQERAKGVTAAWATRGYRRRVGPRATSVTRMRSWARQRPSARTTRTC